MKVLTIKEPYASLIAYGFKKYEFRTWNTKYRGEVLIHSSKVPYSNYKDYDLEIRPSEIVAKGEIVDVIKLDEEKGNEIYKMNPKVYGLHTDGYAWVIENVCIQDDHTKIKGKLGLWNKD